MVSKPEPLTKEHILESFDCGKEPSTGWLKKATLKAQMDGDKLNVNGAPKF